MFHFHSTRASFFLQNKYFQLLSKGFRDHRRKDKQANKNILQNTIYWVFRLIHGNVFVGRRILFRSANLVNAFTVNILKLAPHKQVELHQKMFLPPPRHLFILFSSASSFYSWLYYSPLPLYSSLCNLPLMISFQWYYCVNYWM